MYTYLKTRKLPDHTQKTRHVIIKSEFYEIRDDILYRLSLQQYHKNNSRYIYCVCVPKSFVDTLLDISHRTRHFSTLKIYVNMRNKYFFPKMRKTIEYFVNTCPECQKYKNPNKHVRQYISPTTLPPLLSEISVDLKGPIQRSDCMYKYVLAVIEHTSSYLELVPLTDCSTNTVLRGLYDYFF